MSIVSYRFYCTECTNEEVIKERDLDNTQWKIKSKINHEALCPACNDNVDPDDEEYEKCHQEVVFEDLDNIGGSGAENLREAGIVTRQDVKNASDEDILDVSWVGDGGLQSIREKVQ